jgi:hypothetical protein
VSVAAAWATAQAERAASTASNEPTKIERPGM